MVSVEDSNGFVAQRASFPVEKGDSLSDINVLAVLDEQDFQQLAR